MQVISRKAAKAAGLKYYFTGKPCKRGGHVEKRFVSSFLCMACARDKARERYSELEHAQRQEIRASRSVYLRQWRDANRDRLCADQKIRNAEQKALHPDYFKQYYAENKERRKQEAQAWYSANSEKALENRKLYVAANRDKARVWGRKSANTRRARTNLVFVEVIDPRFVFERDKGICGICLAAVDPTSTWEIDHIIPISKGGPHSYANVQLSHRRCNRAKCNRVPVDGRRHPTLHVRD